MEGNINLEEIAKMAKIAMDKTTARMCANCTQWDRKNGRCGEKGIVTQGVLVCPSHEFETEKIVRTTEHLLKQHEQDCRKAENVMAMGLVLSNTVSCIMVDLEKRVKELRTQEKETRVLSLLRKDLDVAEQVESAFETIEEKLKEIDKQFKFYIQPHINRFASTKGKFDAERYDNVEFNSYDFEELLYKFVKKCLHNEANYNKVFALLDSLENDYPYAMEYKDIEKRKRTGTR